MTASTHKLLIAQAMILLGGMVFAWSSLLSQFMHFGALYGTIFRIQGCTIPNPFLTPCFFGSLGYLAAVFWAVHLVQSPSARSARLLRNFLLFCTLFGLSVISFETAQYFELIGGASISCTPGAAPWATPCFVGTLVFITAYATSIFAARRLRETATIGE